MKAVKAVNAVDPKADSNGVWSLDQDIKSIIEEEQVDKDCTESALQRPHLFQFCEKCEIDKISEGGAEQTVALISGMWVCGQGHPDKLRVL